ncbi:hypothetical protein [Desulfosarcina alkanivorans]|nr:hypothetical protein [Desulfosarcina alkanivorans]
MKPIDAEQNRKMARVVEQRVGNGPSDLVAGWQSMLADLLDRMAAYLRPGATVTFQQLVPDEIAFFQRLSRAVTVPRSAAAFYLPPSVRHQMLGGPSGGEDGTPPPDAGVLVASHVADHGIIVNALFAYPPFTPAVDVYGQGQFVAGYQYDTIEACLAELGDILRRHLAGAPEHPSTHKEKTTHE